MRTHLEVSQCLKLFVPAFQSEELFEAKDKSVFQTVDSKVRRNRVPQKCSNVVSCFFSVSTHDSAWFWSYFDGKAWPNSATPWVQKGNILYHHLAHKVHTEFHTEFLQTYRVLKPFSLSLVTYSRSMQGPCKVQCGSLILRSEGFWATKCHVVYSKTVPYATSAVFLQSFHGWSSLQSNSNFLSNSNTTPNFRQQKDDKRFVQFDHVIRYKTRQGSPNFQPATHVHMPGGLCRSTRSFTTVKKMSKDFGSDEEIERKRKRST